MAFSPISNAATPETTLIRQHLTAAMQEIQAQVHNDSLYTFTYELAPNKEFLVQKLNEPYDRVKHGPCQTKWKDAVKKNPFPRLCYPVLVQGVDQLKKRVAEQKAVMDGFDQEMSRIQTSCNEAAGSLRQLALVEIEKVTQTCLRLQRKFLEMVAKMERLGARRGLVPKTSLVSDKIKDVRVDQEELRHLQEELNRVKTRITQEEKLPYDQVVAQTLKDKEQLSDIFTKIMTITTRQGMLLEELNQGINSQSGV